MTSDALPDAGIAVPVDQLDEQVDVEAGRVQVRAQRVDVALLPVPDEIGEEDAGPPDTGLEERDVEVGEPARDATEEQRLAQCLVRVREAADVVVDVVRHRARRPVQQARVGDRRDAELDAAGPERVVVVVAVEPERVEVVRERGRARGGRDGLAAAAAPRSR